MQLHIDPHSIVTQIVKPIYQYPSAGFSTWDSARCRSTTHANCPAQPLSPKNKVQHITIRLFSRRPTAGFPVSPQVNKFEHFQVVVTSGPLTPVDRVWQNDRQTDRQNRKHYLTATLLVGGKNGNNLSNVNMGLWLFQTARFWPRLWEGYS